MVFVTEMIISKAEMIISECETVVSGSGMIIAEIRTSVYSSEMIISDTRTAVSLMEALIPVVEKMVSEAETIFSATDTVFLEAETAFAVSEKTVGGRRRSCFTSNQQLEAVKKWRIRQVWCSFRQSPDIRWGKKRTVFGPHPYPKNVQIPSIYMGMSGVLNFFPENL
jgi:hypothetical protein